MKSLESTPLRTLGATRAYPREIKISVLIAPEHKRQEKMKAKVRTLTKCNPGTGYDLLPGEIHVLEEFRAKALTDNHLAELIELMPAEEPTLAEEPAEDDGASEPHAA